MYSREGWLYCTVTPLQPPLAFEIHIHEYIITKIVSKYPFSVSAIHILEAHLESSTERLVYWRWGDISRHYITGNGSSGTDFDPLH